MKIKTFNNTNNLLFVSGMFAGGWIWQDTHPKIQNALHHIIDEPLCDIGNTVESISDRVIEVVNGIKEPVTLVGNSLGSLVCLDVARRTTDKINQVVVSGSAGFGEINLGITLTRHSPDLLAKKLVRLVCHDPEKVSIEAETKTTESFARSFRQIMRLIRESNTLQAEIMLRDIHCPVHAIWGENDVITPYEQTKEVLERFSIPTHLIKQCGHSPMFEKPEEFASLVNNILA